MYNKRSAWWLAGLAPNRGDETSLRDIDVAVQVEIPTTRAAVADTLLAIRGCGARGETTNLITGERTSFRPRPSGAPTIKEGFASVFHPFPGGKEIFASIEEGLAREIIGGLEASKTAMFDDQYLSTGGQLYELMTGRDRMLLDARVCSTNDSNARASPPVMPATYDLCTALIAEEAGVIVTDGRGLPLNAPLDTTTDVSWIGYANEAIRREVEPVLLRLLSKHI